ncbi:MAG: type II toxin-antitoxin system YafQ family toxin [Tannerella sp.]|jgi:mRNA interferase YafQ|nr:type II toxin-antitoxin system YafQ family toxin [Tannerella sp.]
MQEQVKLTVKQFFWKIKNFDESAIYTVLYTHQFKKAVNIAFRRNLDLNLLKEIVYRLAQGKELGIKYKPHKLQGYKHDIWECHVQPDWLPLLY